MRSRLLAGAANVAHLAGLGARPKRGAAPVASSPPADADQEDDPPRPVDPPISLGGRQAGDPESDPEDPEGEENEDGEDGEEDEEMRQARARERARCHAILTSPHASQAAAFAAYLAFETTTPRKAALAMLERLPNTNGLDARMGSVTRPNLGNGARPNQFDRHAVATSWDVAFAKARGGSRNQAAAGWDSAMAAARR